MKEEFEIISHEAVHFKVFLVNLLYRTPHIHKDFEICLVLDGSVTLRIPSGQIILHQNDIFITNPFQSHELEADTASLILSLQVSSAFFSDYFPQIEHIEFTSSITAETSDPDLQKHLRRLMLDIAESYFSQTNTSFLKCAGCINDLFYHLFHNIPCKTISEKEKHLSLTKAKRIRSIISYIEAHYDRKLLLSDIAEQENLSLHYLSHFFKEWIGISFQDYLLKIRCEKARQLLLLTDLRLLDICMSCGFSDPKYFNNGFRRQFGYSPKEYRLHFQNEPLPQQQKSMLTTQDFLSIEASRVTLQRYL